MKSWLAPVGESHLHWSVAQPSLPKIWPGACYARAWPRTPTSSSRPGLLSKVQARGLRTGRRKQHRLESEDVDKRPPLTCHFIIPSLICPMELLTPLDWSPAMQRENRAAGVWGEQPAGNEGGLHREVGRRRGWRSFPGSSGWRACVGLLSDPAL